MTDPDLPVAHLIAPAPAGGAETVVRVLARTRFRSGRPTRVVALLDGPEPHPFVDGVREDGVPVEIIPSGQRRYLEEAASVAAALRAQGGGILHTHGYQANVVGGIGARRARAAHVVTHHGHIGGGGVKGWLYEQFDVQSMRRAAAVVAVSGPTAEGLRQRGVRRLFIVRNGLTGAVPLSRAEARARLELPPGAPVIGWVGRMSREKGGDLLFDAVEAVPGTGSRAPLCVVMIGDGPERAALEARVPGLASRDVDVRFPGARADAPLLPRAFDVLALSSRIENLPMVLLEAAAAGTPVVAFGVGGIPEVLDAGTGWVVAPGDVRAFGAALGQALDDPQEAMRRATAARARVEAAFGTDAWAGQMEAVYGEALNPRRGRRR